MLKTLFAATMLLAGCAGSGAESRGGNTTPSDENAVAEQTSDPNAIPAEKFDEIDRFFKGKTRQLENNCYNEEVERTHKKYEGKVTLSLTVSPGGRVRHVKITNSTLDSPGIEQCVVEAVAKWEWPDVPAPAPYVGVINFKPAW